MKYLIHERNFSTIRNASKKFFYNLIALIGLLFISYSAEAYKIITIREAGSFSAGIFGCWGSGSCYKDIIVQSAIAPKPTTTIEKIGEKEIILTFQISALNRENQIYFQDRKIFEQPEDQLLSDVECEGLGLPSGTKMLKGSYDLENNGSTIAVKINIE